MMAKNLTRNMMSFVDRKLKLNPKEWGYAKNGRDEITFIHKSTKEEKVIKKSDYPSINF